MKGVSAQAAAMQGNMHRLGGSYTKALSPQNQLVDSLHRGTVGMRDFAKASQHQRAIWENQIRLAGASGQAYYDAAGNARVMMTQMGGLGDATFRVSDRLRMFNTFLHASSQNLVKWGKNMQWAGRQLTVGFTVPLMFLATQANKFAMEYDRNMTRVIKVNKDASTAAAGSAAEFDLVSDSLRRQTAELTAFGAQMGFTAEETTSAIAEFAQMGYTGFGLDQLVEQATTLSRVSGTDLQTSIEGTRLVAQAFKVELEDLGATFAKLNLVENNTALSLDEMMQGLPVVAAVANTVNLEIEETAGLMAMMKEGGISGKEGATALRTGLLQLVQDATPQTAAAFENIGLNIDEMKGKMREEGDILNFFDQLSDHLDGIQGDSAAAIAQQQDFAAALSKLFGVRQTSRILQVVDGFNQRTEEGTTANRAFIGATTEASEALRVYRFEQEQVDKSMAGIADRLKAEMNVELTKLGENFLVVSNRIRQSIVDIMRWFNGLDDTTKTIVLSFGSLLAVLGPIVMLTGLMANAVGQVTRMFSGILPMTKLLTEAEVAQAIAFGGSTAAINDETMALQANSAAKGRNAAATTAVASSRGGGAAAAGAGAALAADGPRRLRREANGIRNLGTGRFVSPAGVTGRERGGMAARRTGTAIAGAGRGFVGMLKGWTTKFGQTLSRLTPGIVKTLGARITGAFGATRGAAGRVGGAIAGAAGAARGFVGTAMAPLAKMLPASAAGVGALTSAVAALVAIPIIANPKEFFSGFMSAFREPLDRLKATFSGLQEGWQRIMELFRKGGEEGSGLGKIASIFGKIAGFVAGVLADGLRFFLNMLQPIFDVVEAIFHLFEGIGALLEGGEGSGEKFKTAMLEALKAIGRALVGIVATLIEAIADAVDRIPGMDGIANSMRRGAESMREWELLASNINTEISQTERLTREIDDNQSSINDSMKESQGYVDEMIAAKIIEADFLDDAVDSNGEIKDSFIEQLRNNQQLTDEMKTQIFMLLERQRIERNIVSIKRTLAEIEELEASGQYNGNLARMLRYNLERRLEVLLEEENNLAAEARRILLGQVEVMGEMVDISGEAGDEIGGITDEIDEATQAAERFADAWTGALQGGVSEVMGDIATAVMDQFKAEQEAALSVFDTRADAIDAEFEYREQALSDYHEREKEQLSARQEEERKTEEARAERERSNLEARHDREVAAIERASEARLAALDEVDERDEEYERKRERAFEREKARLSFLHNVRTGNIDLQLALARGELSSAAIIRERIGQDRSNFYLEGSNRERGYVMDDRSRARNKERELIKEATSVRLEALRIEQEQEKVALDNMLAARKEQLDKTQEAIEKQLDEAQTARANDLTAQRQNADERLAVEREAAEKGYAARERAIQRTLEEWQRINPATEAEYARHLEALRVDLREHGGSDGSWRRIIDSYSRHTGRSIGEGFETAEKRAMEALGEENKWKNKAEDIVSGLGRGFASGVSESFRAVAEMFGVQIPTGRGRGGGRYRYLEGGAADRFHSGGRVSAGGGAGIKADEKHAVLQSGEYVVQRKAVDRLGVDTLERLNQAHKLGEITPYFHNGGPVDFKKMLKESSGPRESGKTFGKFMSYLANHGAMPTGMGAIGGLNMAGINNLIAPDSDATWRPGGWKNGLSPNVISTVAAVLARIPGGQRITSAFRPGSRVAGTGRLSQHAVGKAVDIGALARSHGGTPQSDRMGDLIAQMFRSLPNVKQVLWKTMTGGNHFNHVHVGFKHSGGLIEDQPDFTTMDLGNNLPSGLIGTIMGGMFNQLASQMGMGMGMAGNPAASGPIKEYAKNLLSTYGWGPGQWGPLHSLVSKESSWNPNAQNPRSTAYGLFQFLNSTWANAGGSKTSDPYEQTRLGYNYIQGRYGSPAAAWDFWKKNNYYHSGGPVSIPQLAKGAHINYDNVVANLHKKETVLTSDLSRKLEAGIDRLYAGDSFGDTIVQIENFHGTEDNIELLAKRLERVDERRAMRRGARRTFG